MEKLPIPNDRVEGLLYAIATGDQTNLPTPKTREEKLLMTILENSAIGGGDPEQIETIIEEKVEEQFQTQLDSVIQDKVDQAVADALGGSGDSSDVEAEIDSWF